jgi:hypothetical protein
MKSIIRISLLILATFFLQNCSSTKVLDAWKAEKSVVDIFKTKNILVIARTANNQARIAFETEIANELRSRGLKATESFTKAPKIYPNKEMSEERMELIKSLMKSEGFNAVVLTVIKDKQETTRTSNNGVYVGASYLTSYPGYYGGFYNYYSQPYAYGPYYDSFGGYIPTETTTYVETSYVLETVAYNLDESTDKQLVAVVTTSLDDPKESHKTADKYVASMIKHLEDK